MSEPTPAGRESLLDALEAVRVQRDGLYAATVNPRRYLERVLGAEGRNDPGLADALVGEALDGLREIEEMARAWDEGRR